MVFGGSHGVAFASVNRIMGACDQQSEGDGEDGDSPEHLGQRCPGGASRSVPSPLSYADMVPVGAASFDGAIE